MKNNWDLLNTDCKNYIIEWKNRLNYFHRGFYYYEDLIFGKIYIYINDITHINVSILDLNSFTIKNKKKFYDFSGNQYIKYIQDKHKIVIYPHYLKLIQYF